MHPEIENLINMALADGEVLEKERTIILLKAESLGVDKDEVEMILDGKIALLKKELATQQTQNNISKSNKEGDLKKCPACGASVQSFTINCSDCGHEFRNTVASNTLKDFFEKFNQIETEERNKIDRTPGKGIFANDKIVIAEDMARKSIANRQAAMIASFPIPNNREDLLGFLTMSIAEAIKEKPNLGILGAAHREYHLVQLINAWRAKSMQIIDKARLSMKNDTKALEEIENLERSLKIGEKTNISSLFKRFKFLFIIVGFCFLISLFMIRGSSSNNNEIVKEKQRLNGLMKEINLSINSKEYDKAIILSNELRWEYESDWDHSSEKYKITWNEKREVLIKEIEKMKVQSK